MLKIKRWSRPASIAFSLLFIAIMCFTLLPLPVHLPFGGAGVASAITTLDYQLAPTDNNIIVYKHNNTTWTLAGLNTQVWAGYSTSTYMKTGGGFRFTNINIPVGATITNAYLSFYAYVTLSGTTVNTYITGDKPASGNSTVFSTLADYQARRGTAAGGANDNLRTTAQVAWDSIGTWTDDNWYNSGNISSIIQEQIQNNWTSGNALAFFWDDHNGRSGAYRQSDYAAGVYPKLHIEYTDPSPTVTTQAATSITTTTATLNGNITNLNGGGNATIRGFKYGLTEADTWDVHEHGDFGTGAFTLPVTGLSAGTLYYVRAYATNPIGTGYGAWVTFTCLGNWIGGYTNRSLLSITDAGGGAVTGHVEQIDAYYNGAPVNSDSCNQYLFRPAVRYVGTHDRTYITSCDHLGKVTIRYWDEDDKTLSAATQLWDFVDGNDHNGCSPIVLQYQTGGNATHNGKILVVGTEFNRAVYSIRSDSAEDISTWGNSRNIEAAVATGCMYAHVCETSDGTIWAFYQKYVNPDYPWYYRTLTLGANADDDAWSAATQCFYIDYSTYCKLWVDGADIHFAFHTVRASSGPDEDVYYIKFQGNDTTWRTADGTAKTLPLNCSDAAHTPDVVFTTTDSPQHYTYINDIRVDGSHNPYILFIDAADIITKHTGKIYRSNYSAGWQNVDTGITSVRFGGGTWLGFAESTFDEGDINTIYAAVPDGSNVSQIQKWVLSGTWSKTEDITQSSPGDNFRPIHVINGAGSCRILWFYAERYTSYADGNWCSQQMAYPGFNSGKYLALKKQVRSDFGDIRFTASDGTTLQPAASSGTPWIEQKADYWMARLWIKAGNIPASGTLTNYVYFGNSSNTNANTQAIMDAQFLVADGFDNGTTLDTDKWTVIAGAVGVASGNLVLTSAASGAGTIAQNTTNYATIPIKAEMRTKSYSDVTNGRYTGAHMMQTSGASADDAVRWYGMDAANTLTFDTRKATVETFTTDATQAYTVANIFRSTWVAAAATYYCSRRYIAATGLAWEQQYTVAHTTNVPLNNLRVVFSEGLVNGTVWYVDWVFVRPWVTPEPTVALGQTLSPPDISNTPSSHDFGVVQPSQTYWAKTNSTTPPSFPLQDGNCTGNVTNNSSFSINVLFSMGNLTGGTQWTIGASPNTNVFRMRVYISGAGNNTVYTALSATPTDLIHELVAAASEYWEFVLDTPTNDPFSDGVLKSGNITLTAEAH